MSVRSAAATRRLHNVHKCKQHVESWETVLQLIKTTYIVLQCVKDQTKLKTTFFFPIEGIQCRSDIRKGVSSNLKLQTVVMMYLEPSAVTSGEQSFALGFGCTAEACFLRPSGWAVWVRHWVRVAH